MKNQTRPRYSTYNFAISLVQVAPNAFLLQETGVGVREKVDAIVHVVIYGHHRVSIIKFRFANLVIFLFGHLSQPLVYPDD